MNSVGVGGAGADGAGGTGRVEGAGKGDVPYKIYKNQSKAKLEEPGRAGPGHSAWNGNKRKCRKRIWIHIIICLGRSGRRSGGAEGAEAALLGQGTLMNEVRSG